LTIKLIVMTLEEVTQELHEASEKKRVCRILLQGEPITRMVQPHGIAQTSKNQIVLVCWQTMGFTKAGGKEGFRNLQLDHIVEIEILELHFQTREDFNPMDRQYKEWVYHI
jgi:predicted DNA-binding transcriptional regulator YafY